MNPPVPVTPDLLRALALPQPKEGSKEERGRVMIIGGSVEVPGAVLLSAVAALRAGAGKLQIATVGSVAVHLGLAMPEALVSAVPETEAGGMARHPGPILKRATKCDAVLIGPGMAEDDSCEGLVDDLLTGMPEQGIVLDAAALSNLCASCGLSRGREGRIVITPHAGEMAQLLDRDRDSVEADPLAAAREAAGRLRVVVVMKGSRSYIVEPAGEEWIYEGGGVGLATSGSGDVLAGIITGLMARGATSSQAALWGVYLHGEAGARRASAQGSLGFLARELAQEVPAILDELRR